MTDFVEYAGVRFEGSTFAELTYSNLAGWDGIPEGRGGGDSIPGGHGVYARTEVLRESRAIVLTANIIANSAERFFELKRMLEALPSVGELRVDQGDGVWSRQVEIQHMPVPDFHARTVTEFTIDMVAPDPVRYSDTITFGPLGLPVLEGGLFLPAPLPWDLGVADLQVAEVTNGGSLPLFPVVTVTGSASAVVLHGGPRDLSFGAFDGSLVFDSLQRRVFLNGADVTRHLMQRNWHEVPPGETHRFSFEAVTPSSGLYMSGEYRIGVW